MVGCCKASSESCGYSIVIGDVFCKNCLGCTIFPGYPSCVDWPNYLFNDCREANDLSFVYCSAAVPDYSAYCFTFLVEAIVVRSPSHVHEFLAFLLGYILLDVGLFHPCKILATLWFQFNEGLKFGCSFLFPCFFFLYHEIFLWPIEQVIHSMNPGSMLLTQGLKGCILFLSMGLFCKPSVQITHHEETIL